MHLSKKKFKQFKVPENSGQIVIIATFAMRRFKLILPLGHSDWRASSQHATNISTQGDQHDNSALIFVVRS